MWLNCERLKSAAKKACLPYLPTNPIPTLAAWIMLVRALFPLFLSTNLTSTAFCSGEYQQQMTAGAAARRSMSSCSYYCRHTSRLSPLMTRAVSFLRLNRLSSW